MLLTGTLIPRARNQPLFSQFLGLCATACSAPISRPHKSALPAINQLQAARGKQCRAAPTDQLCYPDCMARDESSREDLLRQATALIERIELIPHATGPSAASNPLIGEHIVAGFRQGGALSIFFGEDPVYQFNAAGELRRAYCNGKLLKANRARLVTLERVRTEHEVQLVRHELSTQEEAAFLSQMEQHLRGLSWLINANSIEVVGQVPADGNVLSRLKEHLATHDKPRIAMRPNA
jgi:hypothetical protein